MKIKFFHYEFELTLKFEMFQKKKKFQHNRCFGGGKI